MASRLGWMNATHRSSMTPENLINCARLYDHYTNGFSDGNFDSSAHIYLPKIKATSQSTAAGNTHYFSAPTLMDLVNEHDISPVEVDTTCLEQEWFNHEDPYDLAESDRSDAANPDDINIVRCNTRWKIADFVKLDSSPLSSLIKYLAGETDAPIIGAIQAHSYEVTGPVGTPGDWNIDDYC